MRRDTCFRRINALLDPRRRGRTATLILLCFISFTLLYPSREITEEYVKYTPIPLTEYDVRQIKNISRDILWIDNYLDSDQKASDFQVPEWSNKSMTVVTAFFDMGTFQKGKESQKRNSSLYIGWSYTYKYMENPMVIFTDTAEFKHEMLKMREKYSSRTIVIVIPKYLLWSFKLLPWIQKIISEPGYPKYHPNTVIPDYASAMFAKTELVAYAATKNFFNTEYFSWIDLGYYRNIFYRKKKFWLKVPDTLDRNRIALTGVFDVDLEHTKPKEIFLQKMDWIAGGLQISTRNIAIRFNTQFQDALLRYLYQGLVNSDQQVIFAMSTKHEKAKYPLDVELQLFYQTPATRSHMDPGEWFHLGYLMYKELHPNRRKI